MTDDFGEILAVTDVMELLYIGRNTVYQLLNSGELKGFRIGRIWKILRDCLSNYILTKCSKKSMP